MKEEREYFEVEIGESQYDDIELTGIVEARYIHARLEIDEGNPYIEALPLPLSGEALKCVYDIGLPEYHPGETPVLLDELLQIGSLRNVRFRLPFHQSLEDYMYSTLVQSYRARQAAPVEDARLEYTANNEKCHSDNVLYGDAAAPTNGAFGLAGPGGTGKSCSISTVTSHYPQTIRHRDKYGSHVQIVYLVVNCMPNSNMAAVYQGIGAAIDKALGNVEPVYEAEVAHTSGLGKKLELIRRYVELFAIGIIILDEIQLLRFDGRSENSFEAFMVLANETKCAIAVVGTEDAKDKIFHALRTSRRIGAMIETDRYCDDIGLFEKYMEKLFVYQWFEPRVELTPEITETFFDLTKGIIDQLITMYICVSLDYVRKKHKGKAPEVNGKYIKSVITHRYPGILKLLEKMDLRRLAEMNESVRDELEDMIDECIQEEQKKEIVESAEESMDAQILAGKVKDNIVQCVGKTRSVSTIEAAIKTVMKRKSSEGLSEHELTDKVLDHIYNAPKRNSKKTDVKPISTQAMKDVLKEDTEKEI